MFWKELMGHHGRCSPGQSGLSWLRDICALLSPARVSDLRPGRSARLGFDSGLEELGPQTQGGNVDTNYRSRQSEIVIVLKSNCVAGGSPPFKEELLVLGSGSAF